MSNSNLASYVNLSPNYSSRDGNSIKKITIHHMAGNLSIESCGNLFASPARQASSTYGIGTDGRIGRYLDESVRPWTSASYDNDKQAVTIEVANSSTGGNWPVSDAALNSLIRLCVDICKRNGISRLNFTGDASGNLTMHRYFASTNCPGPYLESKYPYIAAEVNRQLSGDTKPEPPAESGSYTVRIVNNAIYVIEGPSPDYDIVQTVYKGEVFTIVEVKNGYGRLKSGAGWINLSYTEKVSGNAPTVDNSYKVQIVNNAIYVLNGPSPNYDIVQTVYKNEVFTIVDTQNGYGKLKSGAGWIYLGYTTRV